MSKSVVAIALSLTALAFVPTEALAYPISTAQAQQCGIGKEPPLALKHALGVRRSGGAACVTGSPATHRVVSKSTL